MTPAVRRRRVQAVALAVLMAGAALEAFAIASGSDAARQGILALIAAAMMAAAIWG